MLCFFHAIVDPFIPLGTTYVHNRWMQTVLPEPGSYLGRMSDGNRGMWMAWSTLDFEPTCRSKVSREVFCSVAVEHVLCPCA